MKTVHTYSKYPDSLPSERYKSPKLCDCNRLAIGYLNHRGSGGVCCTKCNIVYELQPGHDQVLTMFKDAEYETDGFSMTVIWDSGKSSGTLTLEMSESFYRIERFIRRSSRKTEKPPEVTCETIPARKSKRDLYEEAYWKFVNSTTYDDAMYWKNQMEHHVDLALEPGGDNWVSWVKDPVVKEEIKKKHGYDPFYCISAFTLVCCTFILAQLLQLLGVI